MKELSREQVVLWAYEAGFPTNYARNEITRFETFANFVKKHVVNLQETEKPTEK
jgi:hypothetical protein